MECGLNIAVWEIELCGGQKAETDSANNNATTSTAQVQQSATVNTTVDNGKSQTKGSKKGQK